MLRHHFLQFLIVSSLNGCAMVELVEPVEPVEPVGSTLAADPGLDGRGKLIDAIVSRDFPQIEKLISEGVSVNPPANCLWMNPKVPPPSGKASPLVIAIVSTGGLGIVKVLVNAGADINEDACGNPLHNAVGTGQIEITRYLIERGAEVNKPEGGQGSNITPLRMALQPAIKWEAKYELVAMLVENGANVNESIVPEPKEFYSNCHSTLLHEAVFSLRLDITRYLLVHGANPNAKDGGGRTARDCARQRINVIRAFYKNKPQLESHSQSMLQGVESQIQLLLEYEQKH